MVGPFLLAKRKPFPQLQEGSRKVSTELGGLRNDVGSEWETEKHLEQTMVFE